MSFNYYINIYIKRPFIQSIAMLDEWFDRSPVELSFKPHDSVWSIAQILEHIMLFNQRALVAIDQACENVKDHPDTSFDTEQRVNKLRSLEYFNERDNPLANMIGECEPKGVLTTLEIRRRIRAQLSHVLLLVERPKHFGYLNVKSNLKGLEEITVDQLLYIMTTYMQHHLRTALSSAANLIHRRCEDMQVDFTK